MACAVRRERLIARHSYCARCTVDLLVSDMRKELLQLSQRQYVFSAHKIKDFEVQIVVLPVEESTVVPCGSRHRSRFV